MRAFIGLALLTWWLALAPQLESVQPPPTQGAAVIRLRLTVATREMMGIAVLVDRQPHANGTTLYFLTATSLVPRPQSMQASATLTDRPSEIGILRINRDYADAAPQPITFGAPRLGESFAIVGRDVDDRLVTSRQLVRSRTSHHIVGDQEPAPLFECIGAPAVNEDGVFGVVTECPTDRPPTIALLAASRAFLARQIPSLGGWGAVPD